MAFLAILPKAPEKYGRTRFESEALARRNFVLGSMEDNGWITAAQRDAARAMPLGLTDSGNRAVAQVGGYYMEEVRRQLIAEFGETAEDGRSEEHTSELQSLMRNSYAVFCLKQTNTTNHERTIRHTSADQAHCTTR